MLPLGFFWVESRLFLDALLEGVRYMTLQDGTYQHTRLVRGVEGFTLFGTLVKNYRGMAWQTVDLLVAITH